MDDRRSEPGRAAAEPVSADPVTLQPLREPVEPVLSGRVPNAMDEANGAHDGSDRAGASGWSTGPGTGSVTPPRAPSRATATPVDAVGQAVAHDVVALLDLPRWTEHLHALPTWREGDRASSMLLRQPPVRVLLSALRRDAELGSDTAQETLMLLVLSGAASLEWRGEVTRIGEGELAVVPAGGGWRVTSEADETLVLSTFWGTPGTGIADEAGR